MTHIEREELVERYLAGGMSQAEESNFFLHVAVDDELQRTLRAFRIIDQTIQNDRQAVSERSRYRGHVMALLAATPAVIGGGAAATVTAANSIGSASTAVVGGAASVGAAGASAGLGVIKLILAVVLGGSLLVGTGIVVNNAIGDRPAVENAAPPRSVASAPVESVHTAAAVESLGQAGVGAWRTDEPVATRSRVSRRGSAPVRNVQQQSERRRNEPVKLAPITVTNPAKAVVEQNKK